MANLNNRLREARVIFELTQEGSANLFGVPFSTYKRYESGANEPNINVIEGFIRLGLNANWLLTGEGEMLIENMQPLPLAPIGFLDKKRMRMAIETVEEGLAATRSTMEPAKKAELVLAVYDLLEESGVNKAQVLALVKLAA
ncbi:MAG: helix-turn-helix transcriptional regulator [Methylotenera sp.]|nr:helix-turn-helix transcriptional regulator [Methylococcaceae bacterium]MDP3819311.1 helix-turn-helix transcriptional regulator [Methylotenera sp.]